MREKSEFREEKRDVTGCDDAEQRMCLGLDKGAFVGQLFLNSVQGPCYQCLVRGKSLYFSWSFQ